MTVINKKKYPRKEGVTNFDMFKFLLGFEAWGNKTKEIILRLNN